MTDDEFNAIKEAEKERLRLKKKAAAARRAFDRSNNATHVLRSMQQRAQSMLDDTTALTQRVLRDVARGAVRLEQALGSTRATGPADEEAPEADASDAAPAPDAASDPDAAYRAMQADALVRRMKQSASPGADADVAPDARSASAPEDPPRDDAAGGRAAEDDGLPEKTIGRYR